MPRRQPWRSLTRSGCATNSAPAPTWRPLIDISPVGVVLFDAQGGKPISINREAHRIVDRLRSPEQTPEELLQVLSYRRGDGRQLSVTEYPLTRSLTTGETVQGEEIVLQSPDGRQVSTIINATPIHSGDDRVVSVVVTMQDLESLEQFEQMRADFLAMVSHELRAPLSSIKGSAATLLQSGVALEPRTSRDRAVSDRAPEGGGEDSPAVR